MYDDVVGPEKQKTLEELKLLDQQIDRAAELDGLRPIFYRVDEIARQNVDDVDVQVAVGDVRQRIMQRGSLLKAQEETPAAPGRPVFPGAPPPPLPAGGTDWETTSTYPLRPTVHSVPTETLRLPAPPAEPPRVAEKKRGRRTAVAITSIAFVAVIGVAAIIAGRRIGTPRVVPGVAVQIATMPRGASVRVNGELKCISDCALSLLPGNYQIVAELDGYQPAAKSVTTATGQPTALTLTLDPQPATLRIETDLRRGTVLLDNRTAAGLQRGSYIFEKVQPGRHTVKVTGPDGDVSFSFDLAPAKLPAIMGTVVARNVEAVLVASFTNHARVVTSSGPWKLAVNGHQSDDAGPAGVDLPSFDPGPEELVIQQGTDRRSMRENFGPAPILTAFVRTDPQGTLIVSTGEDGVRVFLNGREYPRRTEHGELRIPMLGSVEVRVMKDSFESPSVQRAEVKKGAMMRLEFKMTPSP